MARRPTPRASGAEGATTGFANVQPGEEGAESSVQAVTATVEPSMMSRSIGHDPRNIPAVGAA